MEEDVFSITPSEFVQEFKDLKDYLVKSYFSSDAEDIDISRRRILMNEGLNEDQIELIKRIVNQALTDALYTVIMGLEGNASIYQHQITYKLQDEEGNELTGELSGLAYDAFD